MWTELFMDNKDFLIEELDTIIENLKEYKDAMENDDRKKLVELLREGKERKELIDGR